MTPVICPYCDKPAPLVMGEELYPNRPDLWSKRFYRCNDCDAHVGCHPGTSKPLGVLAGPELRKARIRAHAAFDPLWRGNTGKKKNKERKTSYKWLAMQLGITGRDCHIGHFTKEQCEATIDACRELKGEVPE